MRMMTTTAAGTALNRYLKNIKWIQERYFLELIHYKSIDRISLQTDRIYPQIDRISS